MLLSLRWKSESFLVAPWNFHVGQRFGRLILRQKVRENPAISPTIRKAYVCDCDCGIRLTVPCYYLIRSPNPKVNCGECPDLKSSKTTFNRVYRIHLMMLMRCSDPRHVGYKYYGARGIKVCEEWADPVTGFDAFLAFIGPAPSPKHTIDRVNNDQGYQPSFEGKIQVRWATPEQQANNRRKKHE